MACFVSAGTEPRASTQPTLTLTLTNTALRTFIRACSTGFKPFFLNFPKGSLRLYSDRRLLTSKKRWKFLCRRSVKNLLIKKAFRHHRHQFRFYKLSRAPHVLLRLSDRTVMIFVTNGVGIYPSVVFCIVLFHGAGCASPLVCGSRTTDGPYPSPEFISSCVCGPPVCRDTSFEYTS